MYSIKWIQNVELNLYWDWFIVKGLNQIRKRVGTDIVKWSNQHVFTSIASKNSSLYIVFKAEQPVGFFISSIQVDPFLNVPYSLFIWLIYSEDSSQEPIRLGIEYAKNLAKSLGLACLEGITPRKGWERRFAKYGITPKYTTYWMNLEAKGE